MFTNKKTKEEVLQRPSQAENDEFEKIGVLEFTEEGLNHRKMSHDLWTYYRRLERLIEKDKFQTPEEIINFTESVFTSLISSLPNRVNEFIQQLNDVQSSKVLERIITKLSTEKQIRMLYSEINQFLPQLCFGKYSSFVLQKLLQSSILIIKQENEQNEKKSQQEGEKTDDGYPMMKLMIRDTLDILKNSWTDLLFQKNGSFVLRSIIELIFEFEEFHSYIDQMLNQFFENIKPTQWMYDPIACPVLISFLNTYPNDDEHYKKIIDFLFKNLKSTLITNAMDHTIASRVIDALILTCSDDTILELYKSIKKTFRKLCVSYTGQFGVRNLIKRLPKDLFEASFDKIKEDFRKIFSSFKGILIEIASICVKYETRQSEFMEAFKSLYTTNSIKEILFSTNDQFDRFGCQLLMNVFDFGNITSLMKDFSDLDSEYVSILCTHKNGSLLIEKIIERRPKMLFKKMLNPEKISCNIYGCRVIQKLFKTDELNLKLKLGVELIKFERDLLQDFNGKIVYTNCALRNFKNVNSQKEWKKNEERNLKRKETFSSIIDEEPSKKKFKNEQDEQDSVEKKKESKKESKATKKESKKDETKNEDAKNEIKKETKKEKKERFKKQETKPLTQSTGEDLSFVLDAIQKVGEEKPKTTKKKRK
eukprot:gene243-4489_t